MLQSNCGSIGAIGPGYRDATWNDNGSSFDQTAFGPLRSKQHGHGISVVHRRSSSFFGRSICSFERSIALVSARVVGLLLMKSLVMRGAANASDVGPDTNRLLFAAELA
jgi:hypothetical protein